MTKYCLVQTANYKELFDIHRDTTGQNLKDPLMELILTNRHYTIRHNGNRAQSIHDVLSDTNVDVVIDFFSDTLKPGGNGFMFCPFFQFSGLHENLERLVGDVNVEHYVDPSKTANKVQYDFTVERAPLPFIRCRGNFKSDQRVKKMGHRNMAEVAIHLSPKALTHLHSI